MAACYPNLNLDWLIGGKGRMYKGTEPAVAAPQVPENRQSPADNQDSGLLFDSHEPDLFPKETEVSENKALTTPVSPAEPKDNPPRITKILVFYDNGTFKEIE